MSAFCINAQRISGLNVVSAGTSVGVRFTITKGSACSGYTIYHSIDSVNFSVISDNPGICGASGADEPKSFTHTTPLLNQYNYYKVNLFPVETSPVVKIFVGEQTQSTLIVYPNPISQNGEWLSVKFLNAPGGFPEGFLYSPEGFPLRALAFDTTLNATSIDVSNLKNGLYIIWLTDGYQFYSAKFVILR